MSPRRRKIQIAARTSFPNSGGLHGSDTTTRKISGGDLARRAYPAKVVTLIMSGVSAELSERLAGGPCVYDPKDQTALTILTKYELVDKVSHSIRETLKEANPRSGADRRLDERNRYRFVQQCMLASNDDAVDCMAAQVFRLGLYPVKLNCSDAVEIDEFAREYAKIASLAILAAEGKVTKQEMYERTKESPVCPLTEQQVSDMFPDKADEWGLGLCVVLGGRPIVRLGAHPGKGGPNQELALRFALYWYTYVQQYPILRRYTVWFAGGSSRGRDGNTTAAGAFGYGQLVADIQSEYEKAHLAHEAALLELRRLVRDKRDKSEIKVRTSAEMRADASLLYLSDFARARAIAKAPGYPRSKGSEGLLPLPKRSAKRAWKLLRRTSISGRSA